MALIGLILAVAAGLVVISTIRNPKLKMMLASKTARLPSRANRDDSGLDLYADLNNEVIVLQPGERTLVSTGIRMSVPSGFEGQVRPRSGLALKHGITVANAPGTVDCHFRGIVKVILMNRGFNAFTIRHHDKIAQLVICPVMIVEPEQVEYLDTNTDRGERGFGSSGVKG